MTSGVQNIFEIESGFTQAYERLSFRALGFFVLHVGGLRYGVFEPGATLLANSFDEVGRRISERDSHTCAFASEPDAASIADAVRLAIYVEGPDEDRFFGLSREEFSQLVRSRHLLWAPDGDAAFDDGSYVLQFDVDHQVRLIAFKRTEGLLFDPGSLRDVWMEKSDFYAILQQWYEAFEAEWTLALKIPSTAQMES